MMMNLLTSRITFFGLVYLGVILMGSSNTRAAEIFGYDPAKLFEVKYDRLRVQINDSFVHVYAGPGRGFPKIHAIEKEEWVLVLQSKTNWVKILTKPDTDRGREGWIRREHLVGARIAGEEEKEDAKKIWANESFLNRRFELGFFNGDYASEPLVALRGSWRLNNFFSWEASLAQVTTNLNNIFHYHTNIMAHPLYRQRLSPYFTLGAGYLKDSPKTTIIGSDDVNSETVNVGIGLRAYITRRFMVRAEFRNHLIFLDSDERESNQEYSLGFSFYFGETLQPDDPNFVVPNLKDDDFEFGLFTGVYHFDDFGSEPTVGVHLGYHVTEDFFIEASIAESTADDKDYRDRGIPLFDELNGKADILYYDFAIGYKMLPGEIVVSATKSWPHYFYILAGVGSTEVDEDEYYTTLIGAGFRIYPHDKIGVHLGYRQHLYDVDILGADKSTENMSVEIGVAVAF